MSSFKKPSYLKLGLTHLFLTLCCVIALFPVLRIISISFKDTDTFSHSVQKQFPSRDQATAMDYLRFYTNAVVPFELIEAISNWDDEGNSGESAEKISEANTVTPKPTTDAPDSDSFDEFELLDAQEEESSQGERKWYSNYYDLFTKHLFLQWIYNSLVLSISSALIGIFLAATTAYAFSRFQFPGRKIGLGFLVTTQMIPGPMMIIPIYLVLKSLHLGNSYMGLVLAFTVGSLPFSVMILKGYFDTVPRALEDAARVDGCNQVTAFFRILLPLSTPALAIAFLYNFTAAWSEFVLCSTLIDDVELRPWTLGLMAFQGNFDSRWGLLAAGSVIIAMPTIFLFLYSAKYVVSGMTIGSVKG